MEDTHRVGSLLPELSVSQVEALHRVKEFVESYLPVYPYEYYSLLRIDHAKELLRKGDSIASVSLDLEFESPRAFGKAFKLRFGLTPKEWQKGMR